MNNSVNIREMRPEDGPLVAKLYELTPDTGRISLAPCYQIDPYVSIKESANTTVGIVVEHAVSGIIGAATVEFACLSHNGTMQNVAILGGLSVHPEYRGQGIGKLLAKHRIHLAEEYYGSPPIILAGIQHGNRASMAVARTWMKSSVGEFRSAFVPMRRRPATVRSGDIYIRQLQDDEVADVVEELSRVYSGYEFAPIQTQDALSSWLGYAPMGKRIRDYYVAVDARGQLLAGIGLSKTYEMSTIIVRNMPTWIAMLNKVVHLVPEDGVMRPISVSRFWYAPQHEHALHYLWNDIRYRLRNLGNAIMVYYDPRCLQARALKLPAWLPKGKLELVTSIHHSVTDTPLFVPE